MKLLVEQRNGHLYLTGSNTPLELYDHVPFEINVLTGLLRKIPEIKEERHTLPEGTEFYFDLSATDKPRIYFRILAPLEFVFKTGLETVMGSNIPCEVYKVQYLSNLFHPEIRRFEPFKTQTMHQAYSEASRLLRPSARHHHAHIINHFYVVSTGIPLKAYRESPTIF